MIRGEATYGDEASRDCEGGRQQLSAQARARADTKNFIRERRVERVPVLSGRSSRHGDQG